MEELQSFDPSQKKKKKKISKPVEDSKAVVDSLDDFKFGSKKKKKKQVLVEEEEQTVLNSSKDENGEYKEYDYFELLAKIHKLLGTDSNPEGQKKSVNLPSLEIRMVGTTKTLWTNIRIVAQRLNRDVEHLKQYTLTELAVSGQFDGKYGLKITGRVRLQQLESIVRHYCNEYVICMQCKSYDTQLEKRKGNAEKVIFVSCATCHHDCVKQNINQGYRAATRKTRRAERKNK
jgi:translation initiation factor 2 subunit 2